MDSLFGRAEAAALLAVERANGGEQAPLEQVIVAFEQLFGTTVTPSTFAESLELLIDAHLIDWTQGALELTHEGRKVIRRSGAHWEADFPDKVAAKLGDIAEEDLAEEGSLGHPDETEIREALTALGRDRLAGDIVVTGGEVAPSGIAGDRTTAARLLTGLPAGYGLRVGVPGPAGPGSAATPRGQAGSGPGGS